MEQRLKPMHQNTLQSGTKLMYPCIGTLNRFFLPQQRLVIYRSSNIVCDGISNAKSLKAKPL